MSVIQNINSIFVCVLLSLVSSDTLASPNTTISAGNSYSLAVKPDGSLWAWGINGVGQLGDGTKEDSPIPKLIGNGFSVVAAGGWGRSFAIKKDGSLWGWGLGNLGDGTSSPSSQSF